MLRDLARLAWTLDEWLQEKLGRPYNALLGVGLVIGLVHQIGDMPKDMSGHGLISTLFIIAMDFALLVNQAGQFHQHMERRRAMPRRGEVRKTETSDD